MKRLATVFPGSVLVFATLKRGDELSVDEVRRLSALARWGRSDATNQGVPRAAVIVLTGAELFAEYRVESSWVALGGQHAKFVEPAYVRLDNLQVLADLTQQLYLNMEGYNAKFERRLEQLGSRSGK